MLLHFTSLALAAVVGTKPPIATPAAQTVSADSTAERLLTAEQLNVYIALRKDLRSYWNDSAHAGLHKTAEAKAHASVMDVGGVKLSTKTFDYPSLVKQDAALATIFKKDHFETQQFEPIHLEVGKVLAILTLSERGQASLPDSSTVLGKNVTLVKAHSQELAAVGAVVQATEGGGGDDNLNP